VRWGVVADVECRPGPGLAWLGSVTTSERRLDTESCHGIPARRHTAGGGAPHTFRTHEKDKGLNCRMPRG
jgi:hypothetical protein